MISRVFRSFSNASSYKWSTRLSSRERDSGRPSDNLRENRVFYTLIEKNWKDRFSQNFVGF